MRCDQCQLLRINAVVCHEIGCPNAWRDEVRECKECGQEFSPENRHQSCCDEQCYAAYNGLPMPEDIADDESRAYGPSGAPRGWDHV